jgi:uncharacterized membrane protein
MIMRTQVEHVLDLLRTSFWFVPALFAVGALTLALTLVWVDSTVSTCDSRLLGWLCTIDSQGAGQLLVAIGGSMLTVAGVVFSITIVALSMASAQFGPRLLRNYMRDRGNQIVLGIFIADFVYCLMVLRYVRSEGADPFVPFIAVNFSIVLALVSLGVLIYFFHHVSSTIQADHVVASLGHELTEVIDNWIEENKQAEAPASAELHRPDDMAWRDAADVSTAESGYIQTINYDALLKLAEEHDLCLRVRFRAGHFVMQGMHLIDYLPAVPRREELKAAARDAFIIGRQRTAIQDVEYVIDQINQVAARALSPSLNDPYTAFACADWLGAGLARLATLDFPPARRYAGDGRLRLVVDTLTFEGVVNSAFDEFRNGARPLASVTIRLVEVLAAIAERTDHPARLAALVRQAEMLERGSRNALPEESDRRDVSARYQALLASVAARHESTSSVSGRG